ncbi:MAG: response regulator [Candidatus Delongbacteria bacterium]|nr:response regulator [Candidatus Delongbacteria bacterium]MBN2833684.1 response regulator [Candidatus Delongbacteria bacterium]
MKKKNTLFHKLLLIFVIIKILPLIFMAVVAIHFSLNLGNISKDKIEQVMSHSSAIIDSIGHFSERESISALDEKSKTSVEVRTIDTAKRIADFLYERDHDILFISKNKPSVKLFNNFINNKLAKTHSHGNYKLVDDKWISVDSLTDYKKINFINSDNSKEFNYLPPNSVYEELDTPIYYEITYFDLKGVEQLKITSQNSITDNSLKNISFKQNTFLKAETYFDSLANLSYGEIYVSDLVGRYVKTDLVGIYNKANCEKLKINFDPENSAYAGEENPVGKKFKGIIRWITPYYENSVKTGYISLALNHDHIMELTDRITPTKPGFFDINNAEIGDYTWLWDYEGRNISHPRDYFIFGYDDDGNLVPPWFDTETDSLFLESKLSFDEFSRKYPPFNNPSINKKPSIRQVKEGKIALDGRFLNFAPQCIEWHNITQEGGAGSFQIFWSGLWKLTTVATIPYFTGRFANTGRGFGYVTMGTNVDQFHEAADLTSQKIKKIRDESLAKSEVLKSEVAMFIKEETKDSIRQLSIYTVLMTLIVAVLAYWIAFYITNKILKLIEGTEKFASGDNNYRICVDSKDELGELADSFNKMAETIETNIRIMKQDEVYNKALFEHSSIPLFVMNENLKIIQTNRLFETLTGFLTESIAYENPIMIFDKTFLSRIMELDKNSDIPMVFETIMKTSFNENKNVEVSIQYLNDNKIYLIAIIDLTTKKDMEETLVSALEKANESEKVKTMFLANMSHEIRTPLNAIVGSSEILKSFCTKDNEVNEYLRIIHSSSISLLDIVNNILDFSKIEAGMLKLSSIKFNIVDTIEDVIRIIKATDQDKNLDISINLKNVPNYVVGDPVRFRQVLTNLLGNAFKFTHSGFIKIKIETFSERVDNFFLKVSVSDSGPGISENMQEKVFSPFLQVDGSNRKLYSGTGLGLSISRSIAKSMDGDITLKSPYTLNGEKISGCEFVFTAKFQRASSFISEDFRFEQKREKEVESFLFDRYSFEIDSELDKKKVLVVEDNSVNRKLTKHMMENLGFEVMTAENGKEAVEKYMKHYSDFSVILMDIQMPVMDGIEATDIIRKFEKDIKVLPVKIIALTAHATDGYKEQCYDRGMNGFITKPLKIEKLKESLFLKT